MDLAGSRRTALLAASIGLALTSCSTNARTGAFQLGDDTATCRDHQSVLPSTAYTGGTNGDTESILLMMHYYTAHGTQPYCDGHAPTAEDRAWTHLYVQLGGIGAVKS